MAMGYLGPHDVRSLTGSSIRTVMLESQVDPRSLKTHALRDWRVYPKEDEWTAPLLRNLLEIRAGNWEVIYDDETGESAEDEDINFMKTAICSLLHEGWAGQHLRLFCVSSDH